MRLRYVAVACAALLWAVGGTFARTLLDEGASALDITAARSWIAVIGVGTLLVLRGSSKSRGFVRGHARLIALFGLALAAANYLYYAAIALLPVAVAIVVQYTAPGLVVMWKSISDRSLPHRRVLGALFLALLGVALLSGLTNLKSVELSTAGLLSAFGSAVAFASYIVIGERLSDSLPTERVVFFGFVVASIFWASVIAGRGGDLTLANPDFLPGILFLGIFATILPFLFFLWGLQGVKARTAGIISTLEPLAAALLAFVWLGQELTPAQIFGGIMVVAGIGFVQAERPEQPEVLVERSAVE